MKLWWFSVVNNDSPWFPVRMLAVDMCWPSDEQEADTIAQLAYDPARTPEEQRFGEPVETITIELKGVREPSREKWAELGWTVCGVGSTYVVRQEEMWPH